MPAREALEGIPGVLSRRGWTAIRRETRGREPKSGPAQDPREAIFELAVSRGWILRELAFDAVSLEDVFVRLTRHEEAVPAASRGAGLRPLRREPLRRRPDDAMRKFLAIVGREWRAYFFSPLAYVILAAFLLMNGFIFYAIVHFLNAPGRPKGQALPLLFTNTYFWLFNLFVVPIIAMRLFAEERKTGTIEILLTSPVSETIVVLGKLLGRSRLLSDSLGADARLRLHPAGADADRRRPVAAGYLAIALLGGVFPRRRDVRVDADEEPDRRRDPLPFAMLIPIFSAGLVESMVTDPGKAGACSTISISGTTWTSSLAASWTPGASSTTSRPRRSFSSWPRSRLSAKKETP